MSARSLFITGTDTGIGKTRVACALLRAGAANGLRVAGFKPVAAGVIETPDGFVNEDVLALRAAGNVRLTPAEINPYPLRAPIAPHIAADREGVRIEPARIRAAHAHIAEQADLVIIEGAGGWRVPLDARMTFADLVEEMGWPVVLVAGMRLGCLNHALLSAESIERRCGLTGWVANVLPPAQTALEDNLAALRERMPGRYLGRLCADAELLDASPAGQALVSRGGLPQARPIA